MRRWRAAAAAAVACALATAGASLSAPAEVVPLDAELGPLAHRGERLSYPVYDAAGRKVRDQSWYVTDAGGNCCEVQVAATSTGRLVEFGGSNLNVSDDRGRSWQQVTTLDPKISGEGIVSAAPGGDVVGVGWDFYAGDRLQSFKYDARNRTWRYAETPLHLPFFDRPWLSVVPGPLVWQGREVPYLSVVTAGYTGNVLYVSTDGLDYRPTVPGDQASGSRVVGLVPSRPSRELDHLQPHAAAGFTPLATGVLAANPNLFSPHCTTGLLGSDGRWSCFRLPSGELRPAVLMDSRGWLHQTYASPDADRLTYAVSPDGGRSWRATTLRPPRGGTIERWFDAKANGRIGTAVVGVRAQLPGGLEANYVFRLDVRSATPKLAETYQVGQADLVTGENLAAADGPRFDFASVAILPDGRFAATFADKAHETPALAVLT